MRLCRSSHDLGLRLCHLVLRPDSSNLDLLPKIFGLLVRIVRSKRNTKIQISTRLSRTTKLSSRYRYERSLVFRLPRFKKTGRCVPLPNNSFLTVTMLVVSLSDLSRRFNFSNDNMSCFSETRNATICTQTRR